MSRSPVTKRPMLRLEGGARERRDDDVAVERPLEIRVAGRSLTVTLRTPGHDEELALGFLAAEGVIGSRSDVAALAASEAACEDEPDAVDVTLAPGVAFDWTRLERHFAASAACGLCGRAHLEPLRAGLDPMPRGPGLGPERLLALAGRLAGAQVAFAATGGIHAAAWLDDAFEIRVVREDVGRHNAVDKVAGFLVEAGRYPAGSGLLWASGRAGAEIVLKAARARIPALASVGAPSSLAIAIAESAGMTLIGFLREGRMNVYTGEDRLARPTR